MCKKLLLLVTILHVAFGAPTNCKNSTECDLDEGSGAGNAIHSILGSDTSVVPLMSEDESSILENTQIVDDRVPESDYLPFSSNKSFEGEGSGDEEEGSGFMSPMGTPGPVGSNDHKDDLTPAGVWKELQTVLSDLSEVDIRTESKTTTNPTDEAESIADVSVNETPFVGRKIVKEKNSNSDIKLVQNGTRTGELERASAVPQNSNAVYIVAAVGLFLLVIILICFAKKRQAKNRSNNRKDKLQFAGEELKPLSKPITNDNVNPAKTPEGVPLINGQNGKLRDNSPVLTSYTPLAHPELQAPEKEAKPEMRPKVVDELLTPPRERVTIKATEIPDSIPKTPLLVHRQKNSEGEIITTPVF